MKNYDKQGLARDPDSQMNAFGTGLLFARWLGQTNHSNP